MKLTATNIEELHQRQREYGYLKALNFERIIDEFGELSAKVTIILCNDLLSDTKNVLKLTFYDVLEFETENLNALFVVLLAIQDVSACQLEDSRFHVEDRENNLFSFYCKEITVE